MSLSSLADLARLGAVLPDELRAAQRRGVTGGALVVTRGIRDEIRLATGDMRMSGVGRRGARVGARYTVSGTTSPVAVVKATGPLHLLEHDTKEHDIAPKRGRRGAKALRLANGRFAAAARHPGTTGVRPFEKGYLGTRARTGPIFDAEVQSAIRRALR